MNYTLTTSSDETIENPTIDVIEQNLAVLQDGDFVCLIRKDESENFMQVLCLVPKGASVEDKEFHLEYTKEDGKRRRKQYALQEDVSKSEAVEYFNQFLSNRSNYASLPREEVQLGGNGSFLKKPIIIVIAIIVLLLYAIFPFIK